MHTDSIDKKRIAIWGGGKEGFSALRFVSEKAELEKPLLIDDAPLSDSGSVGVDEVGEVAFLQWSSGTELPDVDVIVRGPGVSCYRPELVAAAKSGIAITTPINLALDCIRNESLTAKIVGITGSKGKSTTTLLTAHVLRESGVRVGVGGNIDRVPLLDQLRDAELVQNTDAWVLELSSYQTADLIHPVDIAVLTSLHPAHLKWHGDMNTYYADKCRLLTELTDCGLVNQADGTIAARFSAWPRAHNFGVAPGFHVTNDAICVGDQTLLARDALPLLGKHNAINACAALAVADALGIEAQQAAKHLPSFQGLPHRLSVLGDLNGITYVDDSIATTPEAALAAIQSLAARPVCVLLGGEEGGQDYGQFAAQLCELSKSQNIVAAVTMYQTGPAIARALNEHNAPFPVLAANDLEHAVELAQQSVSDTDNATILLAPGAPSTDAFSNYIERAERFARAAGFKNA